MRFMENDMETLRKMNMNITDMGIRGRILIAEDNDNIRNTLSNLLKNIGYNVDSVDNGFDARKKMSFENYDVLLSDILMPGIDGIELLKDIRENYGDIPVILITGNQNLESAKEAIRWGAFDYITKPFVELSDIVYSIKRAVEKSYLQRERENLIYELDRKNIHLKNVVRELDRKNASLDFMVRDLQLAMNLSGIMTSERNIDVMLEKMNGDIFELFDVTAWGALLYSNDERCKVKLINVRKSSEELDNNLISMVVRDFHRASGIRIEENMVEVEKKDFFLAETVSGNKHYISELLTVGKKVIGLLFLYTEFREGLETSKLNTLSLISGQLSASLENYNLIEQLTDSNQELKKLSEFKDEVLGIAAHDLRSPLSAISMTGMLLRDFGERMDEIETKEAIDGIVQKAQYLTGMLNELLDISVIESGSILLKKRLGDVAEVIRAHCHQVAPLARSKNIEIEEEIPDTLPHAEFDTGKIGEVLDNLLTNAIKYTSPGGKVKVVARSIEDAVEICISDTGLGIREDELKKLFKKFSRTSAKPTGGETSIGLGLAIAKKIVDIHEGKIWVESEYGKGSKFYFTIPLGNKIIENISVQIKSQQ
jgi:signal transduction histidine kinase/CheY-like chemotaxis protein